MNPKSGVTDAVTLPLAILNTSPTTAVIGISNKLLPLPLKNEPETTPNLEEPVTTKKS